MGTNVDSTLSVIDTAQSEKAGLGVPALFVLLEASRPYAGSSRHLLADIGVVELGRGEARAASREESRLCITLPDKWMSSRHAKIENRLGRWILTDLESKNGTSVNGEATRSRVIADGDLIEVGHSLLRFRLGLSAESSPLDVDSQSRTFRHDAFRTLVPTLEKELAQAGRLATAQDIPFLIRGESGTGKEVLARAVHQLSLRTGKLVAVNCGAIPSNLVESELFGHTRGAFSGAVADKVGFIRSADGGTLLLDEIGDLALASQTALLRVLQEREVQPIGAPHPVSVDIRVLSATHRDLDEMVTAGTFRRDLYARLAGYTVSLPALRDRKDDIGVVVAALWSRLLASRNHAGLTIEAARALANYSWPMNIRELEAALRAAIALARADAIALEHLPAPLRNIGPASDEQRAEYDLSVLLKSKLRERDGNVSAVARALGKDRKQIQRWLKRFGIEADTYR